MLKFITKPNLKRAPRQRRLGASHRRCRIHPTGSNPLGSNRLGTIRDGAAVVEAAFCIPVVIILMLGTLEICSGIYLSESLTVSAYESCRAGIRRRSNQDDVYDRAVEILAERNVTLPVGNDGKLAGITISPADFSTLKALDPITVTFTAPTSGNSMYIFDSLYDRNVTVSVSMVREFDE